MLTGNTTYKETGATDEDVLLYEAMLPELLITAAKKKNKELSPLTKTAFEYLLSNDKEKKEERKAQSELHKYIAAQSVMKQWLKKRLPLRDLIEERDGDMTNEEIKALNYKGYDVEVDGVMHYAYGGDVKKYPHGGTHDDYTHDVLPNGVPFIAATVADQEAYIKSIEQSEKYRKDFEKARKQEEALKKLNEKMSSNSTEKVDDNLRSNQVKNPSSDYGVNSEAYKTSTNKPLIEHANKKTTNAVRTLTGIDRGPSPNKEDTARYNALMAMIHRYGNDDLVINDAQVSPTLGDQIRKMFQYHGMYNNNYITAKNDRMVISELAHLIQDDLGRFGKDRIIKDILSSPFDYTKLYSTKGTFEEEAHKGMEPFLYWEYLRRKENEGIKLTDPHLAETPEGFENRIKALKKKYNTIDYASGGLVRGGTKKVKEYQNWMNRTFGLNLAEDGAWGPKTQAAYEKYVSKNTQLNETISSPDEIARKALQQIITIPSKREYIPMLGNDADGLNTQQYEKFLLNTRTLDNVPPVYAYGGSIQQYPHGGEVHEEEQPEEDVAYMNDFYYSEKDIEELLNKKKVIRKKTSSGEIYETAKYVYCPSGQCLESAYKAWDLTAARKKGVPSSSLLRESLGTTSMTTDQAMKFFAANPRAIEDFPYFSLEGMYDTSVDSWDIHQALVKAGGKNLYTVGLPEDKKGNLVDNPYSFKTLAKSFKTEEDKMKFYASIPIGTIIGFGGALNDSAKKRGWNKAGGMYPNRHSGIVVGYTEDKDGNVVPLVYDTQRKYTPITEAETFITNITTNPKTQHMTVDFLKNEGMYKHSSTTLKINPEEIGMNGKRIKKFTGALEDNKNLLMKELNLTPKKYDEYALMATALTKQESQGGKFNPLKPKSGELGVAKAWSFFRPYAKYGVPGDSTGMSQLNPRNLFDNPRLNEVAETFGITREADLLNSEKSAIATMIYLSSLGPLANKYWDEGSKPGGVREYGPVPRGHTYPGPVFRTEEGENINVPGATHGIIGFLGRVFNDELKVVNEQIENLSNPGRYTAYWAHTDEKGNPVGLGNKIMFSKKTEGNLSKESPDFHPMMPIAYGWQSPYAIKTGDATGVDKKGDIVNTYVKNILTYYNKLKESYDKQQIEN